MSSNPTPLCDPCATERLVRLIVQRLASVGKGDEGNSTSVEVEDLTWTPKELEKSTVQQKDDIELAVAIVQKGIGLKGNRKIAEWAVRTILKSPAISEPFIPTDRSFQKANKEWIRFVTGIDIECRSWHLSSDSNASGICLDNGISPKLDFLQSLEAKSKVFSMHSGYSRRMMLAEFLENITALPEFENVFLLWDGIELSSESKGCKLKGTPWCVLINGIGLDLYDKPQRERLLPLVVIPADVAAITERNFWECVAATATIHKMSIENGGCACSAFGIVSNAYEWQFICIDERGKLWRTQSYFLNFCMEVEDDTLSVYRLLHYCVASSSKRLKLNA